ncbi:MAG: hypothetical protein LUF34_01960 [Lachnospiraceae bacterium]|nr:hypothetical protein [Lachnospiraceae bacterium]
MFSASYVRKNPEEFYKVMKNAFLDATFVKGPSTVHKQLVDLEKQGKLYGIVTQNLNCLHTIAGSHHGKGSGQLFDSIDFAVLCRPGKDYNYREFLRNFSHKDDSCTAGSAE